MLPSFCHHFGIILYAGAHPADPIHHFRSWLRTWAFQTRAQSEGLRLGKGPNGGPLRDPPWGRAPLGEMASSRAILDRKVASANSKDIYSEGGALSVHGWSQKWDFSAERKCTNNLFLIAKLSQIFWKHIRVICFCVFGILGTMLRDRIS